jgi:subtilase family serine protease
VKTFCLALCMLFSAAAVSAQQRDRLSGTIGKRNTVTLRGSRSPRIDGILDEGPLDDRRRIAGLSLRFKPSSTQTAALEQLIADQQNPSSPLYHSWLTPEEFGERFGISESDLAKVTDWLGAQGFRIDRVARSRTYVTFSGTAAQVRDTFQTELHRYRAGPEMHFANTAEAVIPSDLEPLVFSISGLNDFRANARPAPLFNLAKGGHYVAPGDLNTIYNVHTLHEKGLTGAGQNIVIVGQSLFQKADLDLYRSKHGLPPVTPIVIAVPGQPDPGITEGGDFQEAEIDIQFAGIAAPDATLVFVYCDDVWSAVTYAIDQNLGAVISSSYGLCENWALASDISAFRFTGQQASAQGITWVASSGDTGPAGCDDHAADPTAVFGVAVNLPASLPEVTGIGGTEFAEGSGNYWNDKNGADGASVISYIPETGWNDSSASVGLGASSGGTSLFWARPSWQTGLGVPNDDARHVPDVSFTSSWKHDAYAIIYKGDLLNAGGTSAATPFFAGVLALLNQYMVSNGYQSNPGLGNINPRLYQLAQSTTGVFHDIVTGNNIVPCRVGTRNCATGSYGYQAGAGYDHVTGLGSIDIGRLFENWVAKDSGANASAVVLSVEPSPVYRRKSDANGYRFFFTLRLAETAGTSTTITGLTIDGRDYSGQIADFFGGTDLPAYGTLSAALGAKDMDVPANVLFSFSGIDKSGLKWSKELTVAFVAE